MPKYSTERFIKFSRKDTMESKMKKAEMIINTMRIILFVSVFVLCSCNKDEFKVSLYKGQSVEEALRFVGVPAERFETYRKLCMEKHKLSEAEFLEFAEQFTEIRYLADYKQLLCSESLDQIKKASGAQDALDDLATGIQEGNFPFNSDQNRFFVTIRPLKDKDISEHLNFAVRPTNILTVMYYLKKADMSTGGFLTGGQIYVIKQDEGIRLVLPAYSEFHKKIAIVHDDMVRLRKIIESYCADSSRELPGMMNELLSHEDDKEFVVRVTNNFKYIGKGKSLDKASGAIVVYDNSAINSKGVTTALKLGESNIWLINMKELATNEEVE